MAVPVVVGREFRTGALRARGAVWLPARDGARAGWKGEATAEGMALDRSRCFLRLGVSWVTAPAAVLWVSNWT